LKTYVVGESFGELSLLYSVPRQASVQAKIPCVLWSLDRSTFCNIVQSSVVSRRERYDTFLKKVKLFDGMDPYEISRLSEILKQVHFDADEYICRGGTGQRNVFD
jgi:signal-transduction protein with cAMP-binding, CBS, and nucleotidyltransferase domain